MYSDLGKIAAAAEIQVGHRVQANEVRGEKNQQGGR